MPISGAEIEQWLTSKSFTEDDRRQLIASHDHYKLRFAELRQEHFNTYIPMFLDLSSIPMYTPRHKIVDKYLQIYNRLQVAIKRLDMELFDALEKTALPSTASLLERMRDKRNRDRLMADPLMREWFIAESFVDLVAISEKLDLTGEQYNTSNAVLNTYSLKLTKIIKRLNSATLDIRNKWVKLARDNDKLRGGDSTDEVAQRQMQYAIARAWADVIDNYARSIIDDYLLLNKRTMNKIAETLPTTKLRQFRRLYITAEYGNALSMSYDLERILEVVVQQLDVDHEEYSSIRSELPKYQRQLVFLETNLIERKEWEHQRTLPGLPGIKVQAQSTTPMSAALWQTEELRLRREMMAFMKAKIGSQELATLHADLGFVGNERNLRRREKQVITPYSGMNERKSLSAMHLPAVMSKRTIAFYSPMLGLTESQISAVDILYSEYKQAYIDGIEDNIRELRAIRFGIDRREREDGSIRIGHASPIEVERATSLTQRVWKTSAELDQTFFDRLDLISTVHGNISDIWKARLDRLFEVCTVRVRKNISGIGSDELSLNLIRILEEAELEAETIPRVVRQLASVSDEFGILLNQIREARIDAWSARLMYLSWSDREFVNEQQPPEAWSINCDNAENRLASKSRALIQLLRRTITLMIKASDSSGAEQLEMCYNKYAFPDVFARREQILRELNLSQSLANLTNQQHVQLENIASTVMSRCDIICNEMIGIHKSWDEIEWTQDYVNKAKLRYRMDQMVFDYHELEWYQKTQLRLLLAED